ncbi:MAG: ATP-binding protein, partial [Gammaproteobacteria bacterium]|nr:ATP-binding protein [Gammaproteobacteria bacterium]
YVFEVEASNNHGTWSEVPLSYNLRVLPAPWLTSWALAAYGLAALFGLLLVYRSVARRVAITRQIRDTNASLRDEIRERQAQELALNAEKENAQRYLDIVEVMILSLDSQGRITMVNQKGERILGFKESELIGLDFFETLVPESVRRTLRDRFESLDEYDYSESPVVSKDGSERLIAWHAIPLLATQHLPRGILISGADVTQERDLEHQVREAHKMEALGTLASGIAHDFNNVLSSIVGFAELSLTQVPPGSKASHYLEQLEVSAERASNLVQTILAFRGHEEQRVLQPTYVQTVVEEALQLIRPSMPSSIDIHADIDASCAPVIADPTQIHQLIMNLCTNAYQAMGEGGGELGITIAERELSIEESRSHPNRNAGHYLRMVVSDTGIGMDRSTIARIFDPFFTTKHAGGGSGLGMSVVHGIVTRLGGQIEVESEVGRGTQITVMLPCTSEDVAAVPETRVADEHTGGDETILFVDDEADLRVVVAEMLGVLGYRVYVAATGTEALATFEAHHDTIDLVITDQTMPKMLGRQLAEKLREIDATVPIILTSGGGAQDADHGPVDLFMGKPFNIKSLAAAVREAIGPRKSEEAEVVDSGPTERTP